MEAKRIANDDLDAFNNIPSSIIEHILCLLPIKDAVRTSILSKNWRYCWAKIPKLEFDLEDMVNENQLEELLFADWSSGRKKLMRSHYELPRSIFLLRHLTDLHIENCTLDIIVPTLDGFGSLTSLFLRSGRFLEKPLLHLLANCPLLKKLELLFDLTDEGLAELQCINVIELFKRLPVIEDLSISPWIIKYCDDVPPELPIALVHLKRFRFSAMMLLDEYGLKFVFLVIRRSPNLEKIELHVNNDDYLDYEMYKEYQYSSDALKDCADIWLEHLKELEIRDFANLKHEMKFVKLILDRAPMLKKVRIFQRYSSNRIKRDKELKIVRNVLRSSPRVSPLAEIIVQRDD
ncbi:F-box/FBD/LRR-repeat protein-like protein isoform X1 [Tanacetum coccineum]